MLNQELHPEIRFECILQLNENNKVGDNQVALVGFYQNEVFSFQGYCLVGALSGTLNVNQFFMTSHPNQQHIDFYICFSPRTHSLISIQATGFPGTNGEDEETHPPPPPPTSHIHRIELGTSPIGEKLLHYLSQLQQINPNNPFDSILVLMDFSWSQIHLLREANPKLSLFEPTRKQLLRELKTDETAFSDPILPMVYPVISSPPSSLSITYSLPTWEATFQTLFLDFSSLKHDAEKSCLDQITCPSVIAVGSKSVGKSTMNRMLVNLLLSSFPMVAFLDLDPGQSEMTEAGVLSLSLIDFPLLGPGYMYSHRPVLAQYLGAISPTIHPEMYLSHFTKLHKHYTTLAAQFWKEQKIVLPLVVNTMGWVRSLGFELLQQVVQEVHSTHTILLESKESNGWLAAEGNKLFLPTTKLLTAEVIKMMGKSKFNASELYAVSLTYQLLQHSGGQSIHWNHGEKTPWLQPFPLTSPYYPTYALSLDQIRIITPHVEVPYEHVLYSINATLVGLVSLPLTHDIHPEDDADEIQQAIGGPEYLSNLPRHHQYLGLGVVRGISGPTKASSTRFLYISTPLHPELLQQVKTIVRGEMEIPNWLYTWGLPEVVANAPPGPYMTLLPGEGPGSTVMTTRKRVQRFYSIRKDTAS